MKIARLVILAVSLAGCAFEEEPAKNCYYEATIGCGPGCPPRVVKQMIVCPDPPVVPDVDGGS